MEGEKLSIRIYIYIIPKNNIDNCTKAVKYELLRQREEFRLRVFENRILRRMFGLKV